jgi:hypothetical protein
MKFISMATTSHQQLVDEWLLPSFKDDAPLDVYRCDDHGGGKGAWRTPGFDWAVRRKVKFIADTIAANQGDLIVWTDIDIQFFRPVAPVLEALMKDHPEVDMMFQRGSHKHEEVCTGFFVCRCTKKMLFFWRMVQIMMWPFGYLGDQYVINRMMCVFERFRPLPFNLFMVKWAYLPDTFYCPGVNSSRLWKPGDTLDIPEGVYLHHANWTIGIKNKIAQFEYVKGIVEERQ